MVRPIGLVALCALACFAQADLSDDVDSFLGDWATAFSKAETMNLVKMFTSDAVYMPNNGPTVQGVANIKTAVQYQIDTLGSMNPARLMSGYLDDTNTTAFSMVNVTDYKETPTFKYTTGTLLLILTRDTPTAPFSISLWSHNCGFVCNAAGPTLPAMDVSRPCGSGLTSSITGLISQWQDLYTSENTTALSQLYDEHAVVAPAGSGLFYGNIEIGTLFARLKSRGIKSIEVHNDGCGASDSARYAYSFGRVVLTMGGGVTVNTKHVMVLEAGESGYTIVRQLLSNDE